MESAISEELIDTSPMESLPTEILQKILGYLPFKDKIRAERVCKRWKNISTKEVWKDVKKLHIRISDRKSIKISLEPKIRQRGRYFQPERDLPSINFDKLKVIHSLVSRAGQHIEELIFENDFFSESSKHALSLIATHCHNIESMEFDSIKNSDVGAFSRLLRVNKNINSFGCNEAENIIETLPLKDWKSLYIVEHISSNEKERKNKFIALIENSPSLENLQVYYMTKNVLAAISNCKQLKTLCFSEFFETIFNDMMNVTPLLSNLKVLEYSTYEEGLYADNQITDLLRYHCPNLEELTLLQPYIEYSFPLQLENAVFTLPKLKSLILDGRSITDKNLSRLPKLKTLGLMDYGQCTENGILKMVKNSEYLEELNIGDEITVNLLKRLVKNTRKRRKILKIVIFSEIHGEVLNICENSKILLIEKLSEIPYVF